MSGFLPSERLCRRYILSCPTLDSDTIPDDPTIEEVTGEELMSIAQEMIQRTMLATIYMYTRFEAAQRDISEVTVIPLSENKGFVSDLEKQLKENFPIEHRDRFITLLYKEFFTYLRDGGEYSLQGSGKVYSDKRILAEITPLPKRGERTTPRAKAYRFVGDDLVEIE